MGRRQSVVSGNGARHVFRILYLYACNPALFAVFAAHIYMNALSEREVQLLASWERDRRVFVTVGDIADVVGEAGAIANDIARRLARKGALTRIARGKYLVRPLRLQGRPSVSSTAMAAGALLAHLPYYLGGLWSIRHHGLSEQSYGNVVDAFVPRRLQNRSLGVGRVRFHALPPRLFDYGVAPVVMEGLSVKVSDLERTLLDGVDHPRVFDGIDASVQRLRSAVGRADAARLIDYAARGSRASTCQRLGLLLERAGVSSRKLAPLHKRVRETNSLLSLLPHEPRTGPVNQRWSVVENDQ